MHFVFHSGRNRLVPEKTIGGAQGKVLRGGDRPGANALARHGAHVQVGEDGDTPKELNGASERGSERAWREGGR